MKTSSKNKIGGTITALITPFYKQKVDFNSLKKLIYQQLDGGVDGFVIGGTTGESPTLSESELLNIFKFVKNIVPKGFPLILGSGSNSTIETVRKTLLVKKVKAHAALVVVPYYNKPPQEGLYQHFKTVADKAKVPLILYNVPGRTVINLSAETTIRLAKIKNIIGIKEASGDLNYLEIVRAQAHKNFLLLSGDDTTAIDFILKGGHGVISVISHIIPKEMSEMVRIARQGHSQTRLQYERYNKLNKYLGVEANPIPVKWMLYQMGIIRSPELRLPLTELSDAHRLPIQNALLESGALN